VRIECDVLGGGYLTCIGEKEGWVIVGDGGGGGHERVASLNKVVEERLPDLPISSVTLCASTYGYFGRLITFFAGHFSAIFAGLDTCKNRKLRERREGDDVRDNVRSDECRERVPMRATVKKQQTVRVRPLPMNFELFPRCSL
jgi:hypothetical protein